MGLYLLTLQESSKLERQMQDVVPADLTKSASAAVNSNKVGLDHSQALEAAALSRSMQFAPLCELETEQREEA